jgi:hypothetical protein
MRRTGRGLGCAGQRKKSEPVAADHSRDGGKMKHDERGLARCALCNEPLKIGPDARVQYGFEGAGGRGNQRVIVVDGREIHRCAVPRRP